MDWDYKDKHIDSSIDESEFSSSARVIIYAAKSGQAANEQISNFVPIGVIQGYSQAEQKQIEQIFELGSDIPYLIPGRTSGSISLSRILISGADLTNLLSHGMNSDDIRGLDSDKILKSLRDINVPFDFMFCVFGNTNNEDDSTPPAQFKRLFRNCWITSKQESITANQTIIAESVNILYGDTPTFTINPSNA